MYAGNLPARQRQRTKYSGPASIDRREPGQWLFQQIFSGPTNDAYTRSQSALRPTLNIGGMVETIPAIQSG